MKASLFITCLVDNFYPQVAESMARVLHQCGVDLSVPEQQTCCGQPAFNSGYVEEAKASAVTLLEAFADSDYVVSPSGSCTGMAHHYYEDMFQGDTKYEKLARELAEKTYEFSQFMVNVLGITDLGAVFPHRVTYHPSCHGSRILGVKDEPKRLLDAVQDIEFTDLPYGQDCCGFGGTFAAKMSDISIAMVSEKAGHVLETGADVLVGLDMGCLMNIGGRLNRMGQPVRVLHLAQLLQEGIENSKNQTTPVKAGESK
ncbi:(Fe-S)-binding protein [Alicyclobacillus sp. SO9]|uniref:(Fe-S)-binding protein n=1 Tax=Alicyclobacillus sp. SO9 TaxID=2665646 RepID=UPI0018E890D2|nr:(Fe-S)-binding protein [Alicyclobacillus sp. SO9]QQE77878.1 (Fe-S)-binding protein [Alicyclobacillus sp. SO9]